MQLKLTKERLGLKLINDIKKEFSNTSIDKNNIIVSKDDIEVRIPLTMLFQEMKEKNINYRRLLKNYRDIINKMIIENNFRVNYHNLYPIIRSSSFGLDEDVGFQRKHLFLDLDLLYVTDYSDLIKFLMCTDKVDMQKVHEAAMFNIHKIDNVLSKLTPELEIFTTNSDNSYNCSLIFNSNFMKQVKKSVGLNSYLMAIPSSSTILISRDSNGYVNLLKELVKTNKDPNVVSERIYRVIKGEYSYAD